MWKLSGLCASSWPRRLKVVLHCYLLPISSAIYSFVKFVKVKKWRKEKAELEELEFRAKEAKRDAELAREKEKHEREDKRRKEIKHMVRSLIPVFIYKNLCYPAVPRIRFTPQHLSTKNIEEN